MEGIILALLIPFLGTTLGSAFVFFMKDEMHLKTKKTLLGFASGVMIAASIWSLIIASIDMLSNYGKAAVICYTSFHRSYLQAWHFYCSLIPLPHIFIQEVKNQKVQNHSNALLDYSFVGL